MSRILSVLLAAALLLGGTLPVLAHALLRKAIPPVGSTIHVPPAEIALFYSEGVEPSLSTIVVRDAAGAELQSGDPHTAPDNNKELIVAVKALPAGSYTVDWHVTSVDTHKTEGRYTFTVAP